MQFRCPFFALFTVLLSMAFPTPIAAVFHEIAAITILQFDVINFSHAAISTTYVCLLYLFSTHLISSIFYYFAYC
jgi:hypothetical protein